MDGVCLDFSEEEDEFGFLLTTAAVAAAVVLLWRSMTKTTCPVTVDYR
jgi:hypothetical protein